MGKNGGQHMSYTDWARYNQSRNTAALRRGQASYDAQLPPDYYRPEPPEEEGEVELDKEDIRD
jgi:hypothetical protein